MCESVARQHCARRALDTGFTLIELLVVLAIIATLSAMVAPRYWGSVSRSEEAVLKSNLIALRGALDEFKADRGRYPATLQAVVDARYLRAVPIDPITNQNQTWQLVRNTAGNIIDVKSGASQERYEHY